MDMKRILFALLAAAIAPAASSADVSAVEPAETDPTVISAGMAEVLAGRIAESASMGIRALVVGSSGEGVALVGASALEAESVRAGSKLVREVDGVALELNVRRVTANGVELDMPGPALLLRGGYTPLAVPENPPPEFLSYLEANDVPLERLLRLIADQSGVNISASEATLSKRVSIFLRNMPAARAVEEICRATGLWYRRESATDVIRVTTMAEYEQNLSSFREERTETFTLLYPNVIEVAGVIYGLYPERTLLGLGEDELLEDDENDLGRRFRRFQMISDNGGSSFLKMEPPDASSSGGSGSSGVFSFSRGGLSRIGRYEEFNRPMKLKGITSAQAMVLESGLRSGDTNAYESAFSKASGGAATIFLTVSRKTNMLAVRTSDAGAMDEIRRLVRELDVPTPMVLLEVKVMELDITDDFNARFEYGFNRGGQLSGGGYASRSDNVIGGSLGFDPISTEPSIAGALSFQVVSDKIAARIQLLQEDGKVKTLATPTLLTANNEVSRIFDGHEHPVVKGISGQTVIGENQTVTSPATEFDYENVGTMLLITPNINSDRTVTLRVLQENSEVVENGARIPVYSSSSVDAVSYANVDLVHSRSLSGTFVAKDGMAVMAGGLISETEKEVYTRTPILGSIPLIGWLFRGTEKVKERKELIVMIKPHVISTPIEGGRISQELLDALSAHPVKDGRPSMGVFRDGKQHSVVDDVENLVK